MQPARSRKSALAVGALAASATLMIAFGQLPGTMMMSAAAAASKSAKTKTPVPADHPPVAPPPPSEAAATWSDAEIISALEECVRLLAPTGAEVELSKPIRNGQCGTPAPVLLKRVDGV